MPTKFVARLGRTLDARPDRLDLRDRPYLPLVRSLPPFFPSDRDIRQLLPAYVRAKLVLNQGQEGSCTGFGLACVIDFLLFRRGLDESRRRRRLETVSPRMLYHLARFYDEWPGEDYDGSSCRGALKAWHKHGVCSERLWPYRNAQKIARFMAPADGWDVDAMQRRLGVYYRINRESVVDIQAAIYQIGAVYVSASAHDGWDLGASRKPLAGHASLPPIGGLRRADSLGGHAFALVGYNPLGFVVQNSWGRGWGNRGFAVLPYDEWVRYGTDAWVCALGVPADTKASSEVFVRTKTPSAMIRSARVGDVSSAASAGPAISPVVAPWSVDQAYRHTIVMGNDGRVINRIVTNESGPAGVEELVARAPAAWFGGGQAPKRLVIYAHGGLNSEEESIDRIRTLAPYFQANGAYPLFLTWKTGPVETLTDILADELSRVPKPEGGVTDFFERLQEAAAEVLDRTLEVVAGPAAKPIWSQIKQNAEASLEVDRGSFLLVDNLRRLKETVGNLEIHLIGHSAGAIMLGYLLDLLPGRSLTVTSCSLYAPACTATFALEHYASAVTAGTLPRKSLHVHVLSDARERDDTVGPYQKSLLYLVSRALESCHKMPIVGLAEIFNRAAKARQQWNDDQLPAVAAWQKFWGDAPANLHIVDAPQVSTGTLGRKIKATHGSFNNDAAGITGTLKLVLGGALKHPIESLDY